MCNSSHRLDALLKSSFVIASLDVISLNWPFFFLFFPYLLKVSTVLSRVVCCFLAVVDSWLLSVWGGTQNVTSLWSFSLTSKTTRIIFREEEMLGFAFFFFYQHFLFLPHQSSLSFLFLLLPSFLWIIKVDRIRKCD